VSALSFSCSGPACGWAAPRCPGSLARWVGCRGLSSAESAEGPRLRACSRSGFSTKPSVAYNRSPMVTDRQPETIAETAGTDAAATRGPLRVPAPRNRLLDPGDRSAEVQSQSGPTEMDPLDRLLEGFKAFAREHAPLIVLCASLLLLGVGLRVYDLGFPEHITWDEDHFVDNARNYLTGQRDRNDHPPLGKLLMAVAMNTFGDNSFGWRLTACLAGFGSVVLAFFFAKRLTAEVTTGLITAAFVAADGFMVVYARTALLDGLLAFFFLATALALIGASRAWHVALGAFLTGCAASIKFSGVVLLVPLVACCWLYRKALPRWAVVTLLLFPATYLGIFSLGLALTGLPSDPGAVVEKSLSLLQGHARVNQMAHPAASRWYTWFVPTTPITLRYQLVSHNNLRGLVALGNPLLWWGSFVALATVLAVGLRRFHWHMYAVGLVRKPQEATDAGAQPGARPENTPENTPEDRLENALQDVRENTPEEAPEDTPGEARVPQRGLWLCLLWALPIVPWIVSNRDSYLYHYVPSHIFALVAAGVVTAWLYERHRVWALLVVGSVVVACAFYAPLAGQLELTHWGWRQRLFLPVWP